MCELSPVMPVVWFGWEDKQMPPVQDVPVIALTLERFEDVIAKSRWQMVQQSLARARELLAERTVWNINSTARGGGVAEMLRSLIGYARGAGVDARWVTIAGGDDFFQITKRLHNRLHGSPGDGGPLGDAERELFEAQLYECAGALQELVHAGDIVLLHDPQTAGLIPQLARTGARIAWRSHIGLDSPNEVALEAWRFLLPYLCRADACIFSRADYAWAGLEARRLAFIHPSIDVFAVKNRELEPSAVRAILQAAGLLDGTAGSEATFARADGTEGRVRHQATLREQSRLRADTPIVLQVSRWDRLKDPLGVMAGFAGHLADAAHTHLVLAGPATAAISDDPEGPEVLAEVEQAWSQLEAGIRERIHLASLPMEDPDENAVIVNALQRHATVVCQKSIAEGFGLTVAEAMWKSRPVVASRVGGIQDQIVDGQSGILLGDPHDLAAFGRALSRLLARPEWAARVGARAHRRARDQFLGPEHLIQYLTLFERLLDTASGKRRTLPSSGNSDTAR